MLRFDCPEEGTQILAEGIDVERLGPKIGPRDLHGMREGAGYPDLLLCEFAAHQGFHFPVGLV